MTKRTKKVGIAGRFGSKYGRKIRVNVSKIEKLQKAKYICPNCKRKYVKRVSAGIWECKKCKTRFTGGAYEPVSKVKGE